MYDHETFMDTIRGAINSIAYEVAEQDSPPPVKDVSTLAVCAFELGHAMNENLNRIALAFEKANEFETAEMAEYVKQQIASGVEIKLAEKTKRTYIGKQD